MKHLRFADDIMLIAVDLSQIQLMNQLNEESSKIDWKMNLPKTKIMTNIDDDTVKSGNDHKLKLGLKNQTLK